MSHLRTRTGSITAKDPSFLMGGASDGQSGSSLATLSAPSLFLCAPTAIEVPSPSPPLTTVWTIYSSQDDDVWQIRSTCYNSAHIRALPYEQQTIRLHGPIRPGSPPTKVHEQHRLLINQNMAGVSPLVQQPPYYDTKHASSDYLPPPSYCLPAQHRSLQ